MNRLNNILSLLLVIVLLMAVAVRRDKSLFGNKVEDGMGNNAKKVSAGMDSTVLKKLALLPTGVEELQPYVWQTGDGRVIYGSVPYDRKILGYCGHTPVYIVVKEGRIEQVIAGANCESTEYFKQLYDEHLFEKWNGCTLAECSGKQVDAVSGATHSSSAVIQTVAATASKVSDSEADIHAAASPLSLKNVIALLVLLAGFFIAFYKQGGVWRVVLLLLNMLVLGVWCTCYLSMSQFVSWLSHGIHPLQSTVVFVMLLLAVAVPLFTKKKSYYCHYVCPYGSAQELIGMLGFPQWKIPPRFLKILSHLRRVILLVLLVLMWAGVAFEVMDYEVFSIFLFDKAGQVVIFLALGFLLLSLYVPRPYCRFVCPTGQLLDWGRGIRIKRKK